MTGRTRTITRVAVVAILALVLGIVGLGATAPTADATGPGQSDHCPPGTTQVRFERACTKAGFTVTLVSGKDW